MDPLEKSEMSPRQILLNFLLLSSWGWPKQPCLLTPQTHSAMVKASSKFCRRCVGLSAL